MASLFPHASRLRSVFLLTALLLASGCGEATAPVDPPASLRLSPATLGIGDGESARIEVVMLDASGSPITEPPGRSRVQWSSSDASIASVRDGLVSGNRRGSARITATVGSVSASTEVTVRPVAVRLQPTAAEGATSGNGLRLPIAVLALDRHGEAVAGVPVQFVVTGGGGSVSPGALPTDASGRAQTTWRLVSQAASNTLEAHLKERNVAPLTLRASATGVSSLVLSGILPDPVVEGGSATLTGSGFSPLPEQNRVLVGGVPAVVTAATESSLQITVPSSLCQPAGSIEVRIEVGGEGSNPLRHPFRPAELVSLRVGEQRILRDPAGFCLQFAAGGAESYLIGVQSISEAAGSLTPVTLTSVVAGAGGARPLGMQPPAGAPPLPPAAAPGRWADALPERQAAFESRLRAFEREYLGPRMREAIVRETVRGGSILAAAVSQSAQPGDTVPLRMPDLSPGRNACRDFISITTVVRWIGARGIWLEDVANPSGGLVPADFEAMSAFFDTQVYGTITDYFGAPSDIDGNGRIVIVKTKEVNRVGPAGFVVGGDLFPRTTCAASNQAEVYYAHVPDPSGSFGSVRSRAQVVQYSKIVLPHELTHLIQAARRLAASGPSVWQSVWEAEGQATLAEEIMGHAQTGRSSGRNYGAEVIFNTPPVSDTDWYANNAFAGLMQYFGYQSATTQAANAPERCSWLGRLEEQPGSPCSPGSRIPYGVTWSFLRWLSDHHGPRFPGGERGLHQALITSRYSGFRTIQEVVGVPIDSLLAQWAAALYVDDRVAGADARLTLPSWNLLSFEQGAPETGRLQPRQRGFTGFEEAVSVRGGSTAYFRVGGGSRPATAIRAHAGAGNPLPAHIRLWVVRLQ